MKWRNKMIRRIRRYRANKINKLIEKFNILDFDYEFKMTKKSAFCPNSTSPNSGYVWDEYEDRYEIFVVVKYIKYLHKGREIEIEGDNILSVSIIKTFDHNIIRKFYIYGKDNFDKKNKYDLTTMQYHLKVSQEIDLKMQEIMIKEEMDNIMKNLK